MLKMSNPDSSKKTTQIFDHRKSLHDAIIAGCVSEAVAADGTDPVIIFIAAPSGTGKSVMIKMLMQNEALPKNMVQISSATYALLPEYQAYLPKRHPELSEALYEEHCFIRQKIIAKALQSKRSVMIEVHLNEAENQQITGIAAHAQAQGYAVFFLAVTIQPEKFFSNLQKILRVGETLDRREALQEHKMFFSAWRAICGVNHKLLIDFNAELETGGLPFMIAMESEGCLQIFDAPAWDLAQKTAAINVAAETVSEAYPAECAISADVHPMMAESTYGVACPATFQLERLFDFLVTSKPRTAGFGSVSSLLFRDRTSVAPPTSTLSHGLR